MPEPIIQPNEPATVRSAIYGSTENWLSEPSSFAHAAEDARSRRSCIVEQRQIGEPPLLGSCKRSAWKHTTMEVSRTFRAVDAGHSSATTAAMQPSMPVTGDLTALLTE